MAAGEAGMDGEEVRRRRKELGLTQAQLAKLAGVSQGLITGIETGAFRHTKFLHEIARALNTVPENIAPSLRSAVPERQEIADSELMPVYQITYTDDGNTTLMPDDPVDRILKPRMLKHVRGLYGLYVATTSMSPEFELGDLVICNPALPAIIGKPAIAYRPFNTRHTAVRWGTIVKITADTVSLKVWKPVGNRDEIAVLSRHEWRTIHRIAIRILA